MTITDQKLLSLHWGTLDFDWSAVESLFLPFEVHQQLKVKRQELLHIVMTTLVSDTCGHRSRHCLRLNGWHTKIGRWVAAICVGLAARV